MKRLLLSILVALMLVTVMAMPAAAVEEDSIGASVNVNAVVSITLTDASPTSGISFGPVTPGTEDVGDVDQSDGTPAIQVVVESETNTNVDIGIKGAATGSLALTEWEYSLTFAGTKTSLTGSYVEEYTDVGVGSNDFYHWVDVPAGTPAGSQGCTVYYKAVKTGEAF